MSDAPNWRRIKSYLQWTPDGVGRPAQQEVWRAMAWVIAAINNVELLSGTAEAAYLQGYAEGFEHGKNERMDGSRA